jgi:hypothetical protein
MPLWERLLDWEDDGLSTLIGNAQYAAAETETWDKREVGK